MAMLKIYLNEAEQAQVERDAEEVGLSVSTYVKGKLQLQSATRFSQALSDTIDLAEALAPCRFFVPDLYPRTAWNALSREVNAGQLGRRFFEQVEKGNVAGVRYLAMKNQRAYYEKK